jgi:hypothetical protein
MNHPLPKAAPEPVDEDAIAEPPKPTPSWFASTYRDFEAEHLVTQYRQRQEQAVVAEKPTSEAYELYRRRIMERQQALRSEQAADGSRALGTRPMMPEAALQAQQRMLREQRQRNSRNSRVASASAGLLVAGLGAILAGAAIGYAIITQERIKMVDATPVVEAPRLAAASAPLPTAAQSPTPEAASVVVKKSVVSASLNVADAAGQINRAIPLDLSAEPGTPSDALTIRLSGLPKSAYLSKGTRESDSSWLIKAGEEKGLSLVVPESNANTIDVTVAAIETKTGQLAAPPKEMTVALDLPPPVAPAPDIQPASAPPETAVVVPAATDATPIPQPLNLRGGTLATAETTLSPEVQGLIDKGDVLMKAGDLAAARQFYTRAFDLGDGAAALAVAKTYDPQVYADMNVRGMAPDTVKASEWYQKAKAAGVAEAEAALARLGTAALP